MPSVQDLIAFSRPTNSQLNLDLYSTTGAVTGCPGSVSNVAGAQGNPGNSLYMTGGKKKSHGKYKRMRSRRGRKIYRGGGFSFRSQPMNDDAASFGGGPTGHLGQFAAYSNTNVSSPSNMGAHIQYTPAEMSMAAANSGYITGGARRKSRRRGKKSKKRGGRKPRRKTRKSRKRGRRRTRKGGYPGEDEIQKLSARTEKLEQSAKGEFGDLKTKVTGPKTPESGDVDTGTEGMFGRFYSNMREKITGQDKSASRGVCPRVILNSKYPGARAAQCAAEATKKTYSLKHAKGYTGDNFDSMKNGTFSTPGCKLASTLGSVSTASLPECISFKDQKVKTKSEKKNERNIECILKSVSGATKTPAESETPVNADMPSPSSLTPPSEKEDSQPLISMPPPPKGLGLGPDEEMKVSELSFPPLSAPSAVAPGAAAPGAVAPHPVSFPPSAGVPGAPMPPMSGLPHSAVGAPGGPPPGLPSSMTETEDSQLAAASRDIGRVAAEVNRHAGGRRRTKRKGKRKSRKKGKKGKKTKRNSYYDFNALKRALTNAAYQPF